jgi:hypothetical protein
MYEAMEKDLIVELENGTVVSADQIVTKYLKMAQIASGYIIDENKVSHDLIPPMKNPKLLEVRRMFEEEFTGKVIVIANWRRSMDLLEEILAPWNPAVIRGNPWHEASGRTKADEKARFNGDAKCRVMLGQTQAIKFGHTLMGNSADPCLDTLFYENSYSIDDRGQGEQRNQGAGQVGSATMWDFYVTERDREVVLSLQGKEDIVAVALRYDRSTGILPHGSR